MAKASSPQKKRTRPANREAAKAASRAALIDAAARLIPEKGLDVSLDEICAEAGYTRGAFYVHFKNRDELTLAVMSQVGEAWLDAIFGELEETGDFAALATRFLAEMRSGDYPLTRQGGMRPHQLLEACARSPAIRDRYIEFLHDSIERLSVRLVNSQKKKQINPNLNAEQLSSLLIALVIGIHTLYDLDFPMDFNGGLATLLMLLK